MRRSKDRNRGITLKDKRNALVKGLEASFQNKKMVKEFIAELKAIGLDLGKEEVLDKIEQDPSHLMVLISYSGLGITRRLVQVMDKYKG